MGRPFVPVPLSKCRLEGCNGMHYAKGLCKKHYMQRAGENKYGPDNRGIGKIEFPKEIIEKLKDSQN